MFLLIKELFFGAGSGYCHLCSCLLYTSFFGGYFLIKGTIFKRYNTQQVRGQFHHITMSPATIIPVSYTHLVLGTKFNVTAYESEAIRSVVLAQGCEMCIRDRFEDGTLYKEVTPEKYVEGPFMLKRNGKYYFMWSEGGWTGPDYCVAYAIADSPFGPFKREAKILQMCIRDRVSGIWDIPRKCIIR